MIPAPIPADEHQRLRVLRSYRVLDTGPEQDFDELVELASQICGMPVALISLVDQHRQWFKAKVGYIDAPETPRDLAFCSHTILTDDILEVPDAREDQRFVDNPLVTSQTVIAYTGVPLIGQHGQRIGSLCVIDKQPRQLTDQQKKALHVIGRQVINQLELRKKVRQLDTELAEKQIALEREEAAKQRANQASLVKSQFLAHMSHEIRTPLHGMSGLIELLQETPLLPEQQSHLEALASSAQNLRAIINDILDLAKIEAGKMSITPERVDLASVVREAFSLYEPTAIEQGLAFVLDLPADLPRYVLADPLRIKQVMLNLLNNAVKFTEAGEIRLVLQVMAQTDKAAHLRLSVRDTGLGITPAQQERVLKEFEQADSSTAKKYGGTGLGMAIVQKLVSLMRGHMGIVSPLVLSPEVGGPGTEFWIELTLPIAEAMPVASPAVESEPTQAMPSHSRHILVAEDHPVNQTIIRKHLEKLGHTLVIAANGQIAVEQLQAAHFDLVLMDISMPVMDGIAATDHIRHTLHSNIPIIALTANAYEEDRKRYLSMGMDACLGKPFKRQELAAALSPFLSAMTYAQE
jgi:signal transduction histidine kinase/ActR/RegA family two-component response regulator